MTGLFFNDALLPQGWARNVRLVIEAGRITAIAPDSQPEPGDEHHALALPGLLNLHSHAFQRGMAGLAEVRGSSSDSFWTWREVMYRFVGRMTPDDIEAIAAQAYVEMLESGFTRVGEFHYVHHDVSGAPYQNIAELAVRISAASQATGIALTLLPVFYAHAGFGGCAPDAGQRRFINDLDRFARLMEESRRAVTGQQAAVVGIAPHSLRAVSPDELAAIVPLAQNGPIHIHVAEQMREVDECLAWSGQRPVAWLLDHAPIDRRWCFIHATHTTPDELQGMADAGVVAGLCPITEANLGDGIFNAPEFIARGGSYGVGSDSNVLIGAADELRQLEYSQRLANRARNVVTGQASVSTGRTLFDDAVWGGAQALGVETIGLTTGSFADIVSLDTGHIAFAGRARDAILDGWIFAAGQAAVDCVWVGGRKVVTKGQHHDRDRIAARFRQRLEGLLAT